MNTPDEFETLLAAQPFRPLPTAWREEVLAAASSQVTGPERRRRLLPPLNLRHAWASLAAAWLGLALLHFDTPPAPVYSGPLPRPTAGEIQKQFARRQAETATLLALLAPAHSPARGLPPRAPSSPDVL